jgi:hypothetical protein
MWRASATSMYSACGASARNSATASGVTSSLAPPRTSSVGTLSRRGLDEPPPGLVPADVDGARAVQKARIPVPTPASVGVAAQVLLEAVEGLRPRAMRQIDRNRLRRLLHRREPLGGMRPHETLDMGHAAGVHSRHDVDEDKPGEHRINLVAQRQQSGNPAKRRPNGDRLHGSVLRGDAAGNGSGVGRIIGKGVRVRPGSLRGLRAGPVKS